MLFLYIISSNKVFHNFSFSSFQLSCSNPFSCTPLSNIFTCHIFIIFQWILWRELFQLNRAHSIHYSQSIVWVLVMNNQNMWKIIKIAKTNKYKWDRINHSLNITRIILLLISYEMKIPRHLSICSILNTNIRLYRMVLWIQKIENTR